MELSKIIILVEYTIHICINQEQIKIYSMLMLLKYYC